MSHPSHQELDKEVTWGKCIVRPATEKDIVHVANNLREIDKLEASITSAGAYTPLDAMMLALKYDDITLTVLDKNKIPYAIFGGGVAGEWNYIWLLGTNGVEENTRDFIRYSKGIVHKIVEPYGIASNVVHSKNRHALRWLKYCGAQFVRKIKLREELFYEFIIYV